MTTPISTNLIQDSKTLWMGDIEGWMDENYLASLFVGTGSLASVKIIRDKNTGMPAGYGFIEFNNHQSAEQVLKTQNGSPIPQTNKSFRLNWGAQTGGSKINTMGTGQPQNPNRMMGTMGSSMGTSMGPSMPTSMSTSIGPSMGSSMGTSTSNQSQNQEHTIQVGDLDPMITEPIIIEFFKAKYKSCIGAKILTDPLTKLSRGQGFVKFSSYEEKMRALNEMNGALLKGRRIRTGQPQWKSATSDPGMNYNQQGQLMNQMLYMQQINNMMTGQTGYENINQYYPSQQSTSEIDTQQNITQSQQVDPTVQYKPQQNVVEEIPLTKTKQQSQQSISISSEKENIQGMKKEISEKQTIDKEQKEKQYIEENKQNMEESDLTAQYIRFKDQNVDFALNQINMAIMSHRVKIIEQFLPF